MRKEGTAGSQGAPYKVLGNQRVEKLLSLSDNSCHFAYKKIQRGGSYSGTKGQEMLQDVFAKGSVS